MSHFVENPTDFSAECACQGGQCVVARGNFVFLEHGDDLAAVDRLHSKCGYVVIVPDAASAGTSQLYQTSCQRMTDVVEQIFGDHLGAPVSLPQYESEMSLGELCRRSVAVSFDDCKARVEGFDFEDAS